MRPLRRLAVMAAPLALAVAGFGAPAAGAPAETTPPVHSNEQLAAALRQITRASHGRIGLRSAGSSNEGRPLWQATVGSGPIRILYVTQQHGDEPLGTEAALDALRTVGVHDTALSRFIRSRVTLRMLVRANPDGHERDWRQNYDPDCTGAFCTPGRGFDINRWHDPTLDPADNPVPEAAAIQRMWLAFRPAIVVDYHMQGTPMTPDGRAITTSVFWPNHPDATRPVIDRSKQVSVLMHDVLTVGLGAVVSQYPGTPLAGIARNAYGLRGSTSVLVELSSLGDERARFQIRSAYLMMIAVLQAAAADLLRHIDPARADQIPPQAPQSVAADAAD